MSKYVMTVRVYNGHGAESVYTHTAYSEPMLVEHIREVLAKPSDLIEFTVTIEKRHET